MATTTAHLYTRIYEVLIDGAGAGRTLDAADRFARGFPPGYAADLRSTRAKVRPAVFVHLEEGDAILGGEQSSSHLYTIRVSIFRDHYLGYQGVPAQVQAQQVEADRAHFLIRAALCFGPNLAATAAGDATGLGSESLLPGGFRLLRVANLGANDRLLQYQDTFTGLFDFTP